MPAAAVRAPAQRAPFTRLAAGNVQYGVPIGILPRHAITYPLTQFEPRVYIAPGADLSKPWFSWNWVDITAYVRFDLGVTLTVGRRDEASRVNASAATLKLTNDGRFSRNNPLGPWFGLLTRNTPIRMSQNAGSGVYDRYFGYVNEWPVRWTDPTGNDCTVTIQCAGVMRRLSQGETLKSAMYRSHSGRTLGSLVPAVYWALEDGTQATQFASAVSGIAAVSPSGNVDFAALSTLPGSDALPSFRTGASAVFPIPAYTASGAWSVHIAINIPTAPATYQVLATIDTAPGGSVRRYELRIAPGSPPGLEWHAFDSTGALITSLSIDLDGSGPGHPSSSAFFGHWWSIRVAEKTGSPFVPFDSSFGILLFLFLTGLESGDTTQASTAFSPGDASSVSSITLAATAETEGIGFGHIGVHTDSSLIASGTVTALNNATSGALSGWTGEMAHARVNRLCAEEGVPVAAYAQTSALLGPQGIGTLLELVRDCEAADLGILHEHEFGIGYLALSQRYNQTPALTLDFDANEIVMPEPSDDDQRFRNEWTISRENGSSATVRDADSVAASGIYDDSATLNVDTDGQLHDIAAWKVHLGTIDDDRWPRVPVYLHRHTSLIDAWAAMPYGARINILNPPTQLAPDTIDALVEGWAERWNQKTWDVVLNTSPASGYNIGVWDESRWDSASSSLESDITSGATTISVVTSNTDDLWITGSGLDFDINIGGEKLNVSQVSGSTSPQAFTVSRAENGVLKAHSAGAKVSLWDGRVWGL